MTARGWRCARSTPTTTPTTGWRRMTFLQKHAAKGQVVTGLLYVDPDSEDLHTHLDTVETPLNTLEAKDLCPGTAALEKINASLRVSCSSS